MTSQPVDSPGRIFAVIPAAGRSSRMGRPKQLMEVNGRPMLLAVVEPMNACEQIAGVVVVTNSVIASSLDLGAAGASVVLNDEPDTEMIDSVHLAVSHLQRDQGLTPDDGILICPGDQPGLTVDDLACCCQAFARAPEKILIATHNGKRGHPMIFPASLIPFVMSSACEAGLRELPQQHTELIAQFELTTPAVTRNINTPPDYNSLSAT